MPVRAFLCFTLLAVGAFAVFPPASLVGKLGAGCAGNVVEDCGLEATPKPGHGSKASKCM